MPDAMLPSDEESLWEYLHRADFELWSAQNYPLTPVIVLDQFEELFTLGERVPDLVQEFRNDLGDLAENRIPADLAARIDDDEAVAGAIRFAVAQLQVVDQPAGRLPSRSRRMVPAYSRAGTLAGAAASACAAGDALDAVHKPAAHLMTRRRWRDRWWASSPARTSIRGRDTARRRTSVVPDDHDEATEVEPALLSLFCRELNEERKRRGQTQFDEQTGRRRQDATRCRTTTRRACAICRRTLRDSSRPS